MEKLKQMRNLAVLVAISAGQSLVMAQSVTITYGPDVASVPTLSEWGMIAMALVLAVVALIAMRKGGSSKAVLSVALAAAIALGGGANALKEAMAAPVSPTLLMTNQAGGSIVANEGVVTTVVANSTSVSLKILSISPAAVHNNATGCIAGATLLAPNASCTVLTDGSTPQSPD